MNQVDLPWLRHFIGKMNEELESDRSTLYEVDLPNHEVHSRVAIGLGSSEIRLSTRRGVVGYVARTGQTVMLKDAYNDPRFDRSVDRATGYRTKALLTMAVRDAEGKVAGVLQALNKRSGPYTDHDEETMRRYADEIARHLPTVLAAPGAASAALA